MTSNEIHNKVIDMMDNFSKEEFIFDLLAAYGISKTSIKRLKTGDFNLSKNEGEVFYKKKVFFKTGEKGQLLTTIEELSQDPKILRHNPRFIIVTDFDTLLAKDTKFKGKNLDIPIEDLADNYDYFLPLAGAEVYQASNDNEADRNAAYKMAQLYDELVTENKELYNSIEKIHELNVFLSRLLFCYFAEDTGIFETDSIFTNTLVQHTLENGSNTHTFLNQLFDRLNDQKNEGYPAYLLAFPYVNGGLFQNKIDAPVFSAKARKMLIELGELDWENINPDIFGSMIQAVVIPEYRSDLGMHYTSVPNILKLIKPLFLDELYEEFDKSKTVNDYRKLNRRIANMKFFDPACGSGNFLIIVYKEIRRLEVEILKKIVEIDGTFLLVSSSIKLTQFYGIEIDDFAHEVAILSLWLAEHQMNQYFEHQLEGYTEHQSIIPLKKSGTIVAENAARIDWNKVCPIHKDDEVYVIGNPPYLGARMQDEEQKKDMALVFDGIKGYNNMDYIACWFLKGVEYIKGKNAELAFVSTNSICQGEQVALIWPNILSHKIEIGFAYQSFKWVNNAKRNAGVTVIIVSLRNKSNKEKFIFSETIKKEVKNINAYLLDAGDVVVTGRSNSLSNFPVMNFGSMPNDGGGLILSEQEKNEIKLDHPKSLKFIKNFIGGYEFLNGNKRFCLWIKDKDLNEAYEIPPIKNKIDFTKNKRQESNRKATRKLAQKAHQFGEIRHQESDSIIVPATSSERRDYIPIGFLTPETIISNSAMAIYDAQPWLFGVIHSRMHMVWVDAVGGKLKTDYRYSAKLCYNTFPFPDISIKQKESLNQYVFDILDERAKHAEKTMAQLYDPDKMPVGLRNAHKALDEAVERCYRLQPFESDSERLEYLFKMYDEMVRRDTLFAKQKRTRKKRK